MPKEEAKEWLEMLGVEDGGLGNLIRATYRALGLSTYFTTGEKETRAWTIYDGFTAPQVGVGLLSIADVFCVCVCVLRGRVVCVCVCVHLLSSHPALSL